MKRIRTGLLSAFSRKRQKNYPYAAWDAADFRLPDAWKLGENESLGRALIVFYAAGGYDFFQVSDADRYAAAWLDFIGNLYTSIDDGMYAKGDSRFRFPLSEREREQLIRQGVPAVFTMDF